jgi:predicted ATPase
VDLVPARDPADLEYRFVAGLGLSEPAEGRIEDFLVDSLRAAQGLLVVDNCEHLVEAAARIIERIAGSCPGVVVLATSRERLAADGEQVQPVAPLPEPDPAGAGLRDTPAVALFADRLRAAGAPAPAASDLPAVAEVCRRLGGLPLAIELAAARAGSLGVAAVAERPGLDLLAGGRRTGQPQHRSLRAVLDWSHSLLAPAEQLLFRRLGVFRGPVRLADLEQVCAGGPLAQSRVAGALAGLVDKSMVVRPEPDRYRLLDPTRAYAVEQLATHGEDRWLAAAHARYLVGFAERAGAGMYTAREPEWAAGITERLDELRAAHRWAVGHDPDLALRLAVALAWYASYYLRFELHDWAAVAAELPAAAGHPLRPAALASAAAGAWSRGDFAAAAELARRAAELAGPDQPGAARAVHVLGDVAMLEGRFADADRRYAQAARLAVGTEPGIGCEAFGSRAIALAHQGELARARELAEAGQRRAAELGAPGLVAMSRYCAAECRLLTDPAGALPLAQQAREIAAGTGALFVVGLATLASVSIQGRAGADPAAALRAYREAIEHWRRVGNRTQQWVTLRNLVPVLVAAGQDELACVLHGALATAPVRLPDGAPEATALTAAVTRARDRLGAAAARAAGQRGARASLDDLLPPVLAATGTSPPTPPTPEGAGG